MDEKCQLLKQIGEASFAVTELALYLDTHPADAQALTMMKTVKAQRKAAMAQFESKYYPLTIDCVTDANMTNWTWAGAPAPWESEANYVEL